ncbi:hypothetical protein FACS1894132_10150 [Clostridia bacterium]|nr:hypothetical protein FACS1894132_10150 [Clostridia bacterium]
MKVKEKKLIIKFRPFFVLVILFLTFLSCFLAYMLDANDNEDEYIKKWEKIENIEIATPTNNDLINPVPLSEKKNGTYIGECVFIGDSQADALSDYFGKAIEANFTYSIVGKDYPFDSGDIDKIDYICACFPVSASAETMTYNNKIIDKYNSTLLEIANKNGKNYLDTNTVLKGSDGKLKSEYTDKNGEMNVHAYESLREFFLSHTVE